MVVTGSRAEYGLQANLLRMVEADPDLELQLVVTGTHLSPAHGTTEREIQADGIPVAARVDLAQRGDGAQDIAGAIATGIAGFSAVFCRLAPDIVVILGDRFEMLCPAIAAVPASLPVAHIAGGQLTEGTMDDVIRHSLTKMSHLHFTSTETYGKRIVQLGEEPGRVFVVGSLGLDAILNDPRPDRMEFERATGIVLDRRALMVTFHPATLDRVPSECQIEEILAALERRSDVRVIFTMPNADPENNLIRERISAFVSRHSDRASCHESLGRRLYLGALSLVDGVVGNSSSGLIEAPSFGIGTVNVGARQQGRLRPASVVDCAPEREAIAEAIDRILSSGFRASIRGLKNPFGDGHAAERILAVLRSCPLDRLAAKRFHDVDFQLDEAFGKVNP
ncbi:UDP-N-acetylglucosamine 2-epimerase [Rhodovulum sp. ES.010]|uniref:UDP-N-acetylglucosamine 2-epimerase n=1 Tax=Rhodovulum sp. ES.010 TaxID=1882821 RepID=UPI0009406952|nr:UDP-N-acetylglucosamine 2-epimerase [Rhodovulum sp. ES.010]